MPIKTKNDPSVRLGHKILRTLMKRSSSWLQNFIREHSKGEESYS